MRNLGPAQRRLADYSSSFLRAFQPGEKRKSSPKPSSACRHAAVCTHTTLRDAAAQSRTYAAGKSGSPRSCLSAFSSILGVTNARRGPSQFRRRDAKHPEMNINYFSRERERESARHVLTRKATLIRRHFLHFPRKEGLGRVRDPR